uniref:Beta-glucuronidase n=1 Tax=Meloidogyne incognita TaxID=6306 RepID=A0A914KSK9_MELIC
MPHMLMKPGSGNQNEIRLLESLDGLWTFVREPANSEGIGIINNWAEMDLSFEFENATKIPVPAAYNDLSFERDQQNHVGWVWYQRLYWLPSTLINNQKNRLRSFLHFGSVQYFAIVYLNGKEIGRHVGGHLPFQFELELIQNFPNLITIAVNNTLSSYTIPPGEFNIINLSSGNKIIQQTPNFDFFNYAGVLRPIQIWHLPQIFINDIKLIADCYGNLSYSIEINEELQILPKIIVTIFYGNKIVALMEGLSNKTKIEKANLWWPRGMGKPNLYIAEVKLFSENNEILLDVYRETFGFRSVSIEDGLILINKKHFYCFGFGMHEDFEVHGRGFDRSVMIKDLNIFEWLNANCYRTSHYPYSEERAYEADRRGIVVITEVPAVGLRNFVKSLAKLHAKMITEMINRDKNHPSIISWSLANEPLIKGDASFEYFRPITAVFGYLSYRKIFNLFDIICLNRYYGWYHGLGLIDAIKDSLLKELNDFRSQFPSKPIYMTEYGAEAIPGLHEMPSAPFTEQYQVEIIQKTTQVFEELRLAGHLSGEMLWNFADFMTAPSTSRVVGNHKGVLTRDRKPKMAAHFIKRRYGYLLNEQKRLFLKNEL